MLKATAGILFYSVGEQEEVLSKTAQELPKTPLQQSPGLWGLLDTHLGLGSP